MEFIISQPFTLVEEAFRAPWGPVGPDSLARDSRDWLGARTFLWSSK